MELTDKLDSTEKRKLNLDEFLDIAKNTNPSDWYLNRNSDKAFTQYFYDFNENKFSVDKNEYSSLSITKWHAGRQNVIKEGGYNLRFNGYEIGKFRGVINSEIIKLFDNIESTSINELNWKYIESMKNMMSLNKNKKTSKSYWNRKLNDALKLVDNMYMFGGIEGKNPFYVLNTSLETLQGAPTLHQEKFIKSLIPEHVRCLEKDMKEGELWDETILAREGVPLEYIGQVLALGKFSDFLSNPHKWYSAYEMVRIESMLKLKSNRMAIIHLQKSPDFEGMVKHYK